jgi:hypothetical protein
MIDYRFSINDIMKAAENKHGIKGWQAHSWERCGKDSIVTGDIPIGVFKSGSRKGESKFKGKGQKVIITKDELIKVAIEYETTTGKCWDCHGTGQELVGWDKSEGSIYRSCQRCQGTGEAAKAAIYSPKENI